jgi:hypothetical protein
LTIVRGACEGTLYNRKSEELRINEATLAVEMTTNIFNKCVINGMWGRWETNDYSIRLLPLAFQPELGKIKRDTEVAQWKRGTTCIPSNTLMVNPVDCSEAIIALYSMYHLPSFTAEERSSTDRGTDQANPVGMIRVNAYSCVYATVRSCSANVCNLINGPWSIEATSVKYHLENFVYDPCITKGQYGYWNDDVGRVNVQIGEAIP